MIATQANLQEDVLNRGPHDKDLEAEGLFSILFGDEGSSSATERIDKRSLYSAACENEASVSSSSTSTLQQAARTRKRLSDEKSSKQHTKKAKKHQATDEDRESAVSDAPASKKGSPPSQKETGNTICSNDLMLISLFAKR